MKLEDADPSWIIFLLQSVNVVKVMFFGLLQLSIDSWIQLMFGVLKWKIILGNWSF